jgi:hypothetical protein
MPAQNDYWATGKWDATHWGDGIPVHDARDGGRPCRSTRPTWPAAANATRSVARSATARPATGKGITSKYGLNGAASYHVDRLRQMSDGEIFNTITNGKGQMLGYGYNIAIDDRWRIVMYIRALQRSQNATLQDASPEEQTQLEKAKSRRAPAHARCTGCARRSEVRRRMGPIYANSTQLQPKRP